LDEAVTGDEEDIAIVDGCLALDDLPAVQCLAIEQRDALAFVCLLRRGARTQHGDRCHHYDTAQNT